MVKRSKSCYRRQRARKMADIENYDYEDKFSSSGICNRFSYDDQNQSIQTVEILVPQNTKNSIKGV